MRRRVLTQAESRVGNVGTELGSHLGPGQRTWSLRLRELYSACVLGKCETGEDSFDNGVFIASRGKN